MKLKNRLKRKLGLRTKIEKSEELMKAISEGLRKGLTENVPELRERQADERNQLK